MQPMVTAFGLGCEVRKPLVDGFQESSDTMSGYEGENILGQRGCSATAFLPLQLS
jgi:hypothetical protein